MPKAEIPLLAKQEAIFQPVAMSVLKDLCTMLIGHQNIPVRVSYRGLDKKNKNWMIGNIKNRTLHKTHNEILTSTYNFEYDENIASTKLNNLDNFAALADSETSFRLRPVKVQTKGVLGVTLLYKSKGELESIVASLRRRLIRNKHQTYHTVQYIYHLPQTVKDFLIVIQRYRQAVLGVTETFEDYMSRMIDTRFTYVSDQTVSASMELGFKETLSGVVGYFTSDLVNPDITFDDSIGMWTMDFTYEFIADLPDVLEMTYDSVVYNKLLPKLYRTMLTRDNRIQGLLDMGQAAAMKNGLYFKDIIEQEKLWNRKYVHIPSFDAHNTIITPSNYVPVFSVLALITKDDKRSLFNLGDLGEYKLNNDMLAFIRDHDREYIGEHLESIFNITLYDEKGNPVPVGLAVDENLNVMAKEDLDLTKTYRVLFSTIIDASTIHKDALSRAEKYYPLLGELISALSKDGFPVDENAGSYVRIKSERPYTYTFASWVTTHTLDLNDDIK